MFNYSFRFKGNVSSIIKLYSGFSAPASGESNRMSSVECAAKVAASMSLDSDEPRKKFNAFAYDHQSKTCILGTVSPFSTNFDTTARMNRTDTTTGSLYVLQDCIPKSRIVRLSNFIPSSILRKIL